MIEIWNAIEWAIYGFVAGFVAKPVWNLCQRVWQEAKLARDEWSQPRG
jgi:hypothetical protein